MADKTYQVDLHGAELSEALNQINEYLPEQWATGTIKGVPVPVDNPRHEDNARYWSEMAKSYISPEGAAGAIRWDKDQRLTQDAKQTAQSNIGLSDVLRFTDQALSPGMQQTVLSNLGLLDVLRSTAQHLTDGQKQQTRQNINADAKWEYVTMNLLASQWVDKTYSLESIKPFAEYNLFVDPYEAAMSDDQFESYINAKMCGSPSSNIIKARGDVPSIDIPIVLYFQRKE